MYSVLYFNSTLSDQDITVLASSTYDLVVQPECRCPPSHPVALEHDCVDTAGNDHISRINTASHDVSLLNDGDSSTWWQSMSGEVPVNVTISLGGLREATLVAIHFRSLLPRAMVLHYSTNGLNFSPRQYYAANCSIFGQENNQHLDSSTDVNCITTYSAPLVDQYAEFRVLDVGNRPGADSIESFNLSPELQQFAMATHIRIELVDWNTQDPGQQYFAIYEVVVRGQACVCSGHASSCDEAECVCQHNTMGPHCNQCQPLYNNRPWQPGTTSANICEMCECNGHATSCVYEINSQAGICVNCTDNTRGSNCESCLDFYYWSSENPFASPNACQPCGCHLLGVSGDGDCLRGDNADGSDSGQCSCNAFVIGRSCDKCKEGHYNLSASNPLGCRECECNTTGTVGGSNVCEEEGGQCPCKANVVGATCSSCAANHYGIEREEGCEACHPECLECSGPRATNCLVSLTQPLLRQPY